MDNIKTAGEYFKEGFTSIGVPSDKVRYIWASEIVKELTYWEKVIKIALTSSVSRMKRSLTIAGRSMGSDEMKTALLFYPCMQAADIFQMNLEVACSGIDQRKVHMLAREVADDLKMKKPVCVHTPLLLGLEPPGETNEVYDEIQNYSLRIGAKMSKSKTENCIFIHDSPEDIGKKMEGAYCPPKEVDTNPVIDIIQYAIFPAKAEFNLKRAAKFGGDIDYTNIPDLKEAYSKGLIHPLDLKKSTVENLNTILEGTRRYFTNSSRARELLEKVEKLEVTR